MPGSPTPVAEQFGSLLASIERRLQALERQQQLVFTDPTGATGDPEHGHAVAVTGSLQAICGIAGFGIAVWTGSAWSKVT